MRSCKITQIATLEMNAKDKQITYIEDAGYCVWCRHQSSNALFRQIFMDPWKSGQQLSLTLAASSSTTTAVA
jgi:hypothetical protein